MANRAQRRAPCTCGSGKRYAKCCGRPTPVQPQERSPREEIFYFGFDHDQVARAGSDLGVLAAQRPETIKLELNQHRKDGKAPKPLYFLDLDPALPLSEQLFAYDFIMAVDTNTPDELVDGERVSVTAAMLTTLHRPAEGGARPFARLVARMALELRNLQEPKEPFGWREAIEGLRHHPGLLPEGARVLVIVDAHVRELGAFNERKAPLVPGYFLPQGFTLMFATADVPAAYPNKLLRAADLLGRQMSRRIVGNERGDEGFVTSPVGAPCTRARLWKVPNRIPADGWRRGRSSGGR